MQQSDVTTTVPIFNEEFNLGPLAKPETLEEFQGRSELKLG